MDLSSITPAVFIATCSLVTAVTSLFVALFNYRRSNHTVVGYEAIRYSAIQAMGENAGRMYAQLQVRIRNLGIPVHGLSMWISFKQGNNLGDASIQLRPKKGNKDGLLEGQFAKGMFAEFFLKSYELSDEFGARAIESLRDPRLQNARLVLKSDEYVAGEFRLHGRFDFAKRWWNGPAHWLMRKLLEWESQKPRDRRWNYYKAIPAFTLISEQVERFAEACRKSRSW